MNICLIMPNVFPVPATKGGAVETLATNLLLENEKEGKINFTCFSIYEKEAAELSKNYKYTKFIYIKEQTENIDLTFKTVNNHFKNYMDKIYEYIKDMRYDCLIVEGGDVAGYEPLLRKLPKEKCLVHLHGSGKEAHNEVISEIYSKFITISKSQTKIALKNKLISEAQILFLYNAINLQEFNKKNSDNENDILRQKYQIEKDDTVIMYIGRTIPKKGVKELILAFKQIENIDKAKILIVGSTSFGLEQKTEYDYELQRISEDIKDKIKFTGYIENNELYKIQNIADIAVVPSIWEEPFGLVVVENMAIGLPLVVTNMGGIPELVTEETAFVVENDENLISNFASKLDILIENTELRKKMGEAGRKRAELFSMENYLENFYNIMKKIK